MPQPAKGERSLIGSRVPLDHKQAYMEAAASHGLQMSDYLAVCLAELHGLELPEWIRKKREQQELPLAVQRKPGRPRREDQETPLTKAS